MVEDLLLWPNIQLENLKQGFQVSRHESNYNAVSQSWNTHGV